MKQNILSILFGISTFFLMITCAVAVPIYFRPFYFWHIKALNLEDSGYSAAQIKEAYNEILDYLTLPGGSFHAGDFPFTAEGASHFTDCKLLFTLNAVILVASAFTIILLLLLQKKKKIIVKISALPPMNTQKILILQTWKCRQTEWII